MGECDLYNTSYADPSYIQAHIFATVIENNNPLAELNLFVLSNYYYKLIITVFRCFYKN